MDTLLNHKDNLHHFYIIEGDKENILSQLLDFFENKLKFQTHANPLFYNFSWDRLLIDPAREIISKYTIKTSNSEKKIFLLSFNSITIETQNALLKAFEEPIKDTYFFILVPNANIFLPTVLSRAILIQEKSENKEFKKIVDEVLAKSLGDRISWVEDITEKIKAEKLEKQYAKKFIEALILKLKKELEAGKDVADKIKTVNQIYDYLGLTGASVKMLLERAVLVI